MTKTYKNNVYDLEERTAKFGKEIIVMCKKTMANHITKPIVNQLVRSGTSIGANYMEANGASSRKDFRNKIFICKKEAMETKYWVRMLSEADNTQVALCRKMWREAQELTLIFSKIAKNSG
jgi:four helix bundle protein